MKDLWKKIAVMVLIGLPYFVVLSELRAAAVELGWKADVGGYAFVIILTVMGIVLLFSPIGED